MKSTVPIRTPHDTVKRGAMRRGGRDETVRESIKRGIMENASGKMYGITEGRTA